MISCDAVGPLLPHHPDSDEAPEVRDAVSGHLRACPSCADAWRRLQSAWASLGVWEDVSPPADFIENVRLRVLRQAAPSRRRAWLPLASAAGFLLAVGAFLLVPSAKPDAGLTPAEIEIVRHLDLLENYEMAEAVDLLESGASLDELASLMDLIPAPDAGAGAPAAKEY